MANFTLEIRDINQAVVQSWELPDSTEDLVSDPNTDEMQIPLYGVNGLCYVFVRNPREHATPPAAQ
jgi:hypothetical protein